MLLRADIRSFLVLVVNPIQTRYRLLDCFKNKQRGYLSFTEEVHDSCHIYKNISLKLQRLIHDVAGCFENLNEKNTFAHL